LSFVQPNGILGWSGLRSRTALALFVVLVLSGGALVFAAGEARAQQRPAPEADATVTEPERTPLFGWGISEPAAGTLPADSSPSRVDERDAGSSSGFEPDPVTSYAPAPALELPEEIYPASWIDLLPEEAMSESLGATFGPYPAHDPALALPEPGLVPSPWYLEPFVDPPPATSPASFEPALPYPVLASEPAWGPVVPEAYKPLPLRIEDKPSVLSPAGTPEDALKGARPTPHGENAVAKAVPVGPLPPFADRKASSPGLVFQEPPMPAPVAGPSREASLLLSSVEAATDSAVEALHGVAGDLSETLSPSSEAPAEIPSGGTTESSSEDTPPPPSPAPLGGSYFSPSVGGQVGPGGVVPLLICVLAVGLVLLRPLVGRLSWATCELPKPTSVLLLPLERPG
jgi:hypothetical protein